MRFLPALAMATLLGCSDDKTTTPPTPDTTPPTVESTSPADAATSVPLTTMISATFSEEMDKWTFNNVTFVVSGSVTGNIQYSDKTVTLAPSSPLAYNQQYTVALTTDITDLAGNPLESDYTWSFRTTPGTIMPLAVGNLWEFVKATYDTISGDSVVTLDTIAIVRDSVIQSETWFVGKTGKMYINRSSGLWGRSSGGEAYLFLKYPAVAGDFYPGSPDLGETINVESTNILWGVPHGNHICYYYLSTVSDPTFKYRYYYKPNLGPVVHEKVTTSQKIVERKKLKSLTLM